MVKKFVKKQCKFCKEGVETLDYKNPELYWGCLTRYGTIRPRYYSGVCIRHQKAFALAVKHARHMGLLPFVKR